MNKAWIAFFLALFLTCWLTPQVKNLAIRFGAVDRPDSRRVHKGVIPRLGGLAIFGAFMLAIVVTHTSQWGIEFVGFLVGAVLIVGLGVADDIWQIPARWKLLGQIVAASAVVLTGSQVQWLTNPFGGYFYLKWLAVPFTILWIVSMINVVNLLDGLDGLAAGIVAIAALTVLIVSILQQIWLIAILMAALSGACLGFLIYNFNPAQIFMGDTGSMLLGYVMGAAAVMGAVKSATTLALVVPCIALGLPIMDTAFAIFRRKRAGQPVFKPDKGHLHHRLLAMGLSQKKAVLAMYFFSICLALGAIALSELPRLIGMAVVAALMILAVAGAIKIGILRYGDPNEL
jgi:UDP-N-acetylmuramyl pentapeptide phosphotransferase/UDP-N-acetylglucosamine-1-phosphate transferase